MRLAPGLPDSLRYHHRPALNAAAKAIQARLQSRASRVETLCGPLAFSTSRSTARAMMTNTMKTAHMVGVAMLNMSAPWVAKCIRAPENRGLAKVLLTGICLSNRGRCNPVLTMR